MSEVTVGAAVSNDAADMAALLIKGVSKYYGATTALAPTDLTVRRGEFVTLLGPSGSGKTTLLQIVAGIVTPDDGQVFLGGRNITRVAPAQRGLGMVFQNYALMPHMSVYENIAFPLRIRKIGRNEIRTRVMEALDLMRLPRDAAQRKPKQLSGGQQQRIAIARCLVYNPSVILMDEPLGALDRKLREQIQIELRRLHEELKITVLFVTHDQEEALMLSDRIVVMNNGYVEQEGATDEIYCNPQTVFTADFMGESNLLDAEVIDSDQVVRLRALEGALFFSNSSVAVRDGSKVKLMVRPEYIKVIGREEADYENSIEGTIETTYFIGGFVKYYVRAGNTQLIVKELYKVGMTIPPRGAKVTLGWHRESSLILL